MLQLFKSWLKSNLISLGIIAGLLGFILIKNETHHFRNESSTVDTTLKPVSFYFKDGVKHEQLNTQVITDKKAFNDATKDVKDGIKGRVEVQTVTKYITKTDTVFKYLPIKDTTNSQGDSLYSFEKKDNYVDIKAIANITNRTGQITFKSIDTLTYTDLVQKHLFRSNERKVDISHKGPYNEIVYGNSIILKEKKPIIDVVLFAGYDPFIKKRVFAIGAGLHICSIKTR